MSNNNYGTLKLILVIVAAVVIGGMVLNLVTALLHSLLPWALAALVIYVVYNIATNRPVLGGKRRILP